MRKSSSKSSLRTQGQSQSTPTLASPTSASTSTSTSTTLSIDVAAEPAKSQGPTVPFPDSAAADAVFVKVQAANARLMERTPFAIDDAGDEEDESEDELEEVDNDDQVMDEVRLLWLWVISLGGARLMVVGNRWMRSWRRMIRGLRRRIRRLRKVCFVFVRSFGVGIMIDLGWFLRFTAC
jgi:hypothetical protein